MAEKKKPAPERAAILKDLQALCPQDQEGQALYPTLFDLMSPRWSGLTPTRQAARVNLRMEGSVFRLTIDCPTEGLMCVLHFNSIVELFRQAETVLASGKAVWSPNYEMQKRYRPVIDEVIQ
jgi:hypothetical protein